MVKVWRRRGLGRSAAAIVVAYALALQALLLAYGGALHAAPRGADPFTTLCLGTGPAEQGPEAPSKTHEGRCCTLACSGLHPFAAPPPVAQAPAERAISQLSAPSGFASHPLGGWPVRPLGARAPPLAV